MEIIIDIFNNLLFINNDKVTNIRTKVEYPIFHGEEPNDRFILLSDNGEWTKVNYGLLLLYAYKKFFLPTKFWKKVSVDFINDKDDSFIVENLYPVYPSEGIEHETLEGFYYIPSYELNVINKEGTVIDLLKGKRREFTPEIDCKKENAKYVYAPVRLNENKCKGRVLHRLLALVFKNPPKGYPNLVVDHKNGNKRDFRLDNLEWVTSRENNLRAVQTGLKQDGNMIQVKDKETGDIKEYPSLTEFARELNVHPQYIADGKNNRNQTYKKRYIIKDINDERDWSYFERIALTNESIGIKARNVQTGEITHYRSTKQASKLTNTHQNAIAQYFRNKSEPAIINGYEFKLESDYSPWHEFSKYQLEIYRKGMHRNTTVYEFTDTRNGETSIVYGWKPIHERTGLSKRAIIKSSKGSGKLGTSYRLKILN